jgi:protein involved in ribonucleotide reduction
MLYDNLSSVSQNVLKFYQQLTGEERRIPFIFDDFHFCRSRVIGLDMTENRIFTLCRMIQCNLSSVSQNVLKFYQQLTVEERRVPFIFGRNNQ